MNLAGKWGERLRSEAAGYARVALTNIKREFPSLIIHTMDKPGDFPFRPRARTPVFYGSYDWHSCVEMHWLLVRLLRIAANAVPAKEIKTALRAHFSRVPMEAEAEFIGGPDGIQERPYGWAWALALIEETQALECPDGEKWAAAMEPLAEAVAGAFLQWLLRAGYPVRYGLHSNTAFSLSRALPFARRQAHAGQPALLEAITARAQQWYAADTLYPAAFEPSGHDFLSPALCEAELLAQVMPEGEFGSWLSFFLPGIAGGEPACLFKPVDVTGTTDGQIAHLHGLNASRAWCWRRIAEALPKGDDRISPAIDAAQAHAEAVLPHVTGDDYMVEHWVPSYAVLMLS